MHKFMKTALVLSLVNVLVTGCGFLGSSSSRSYLLEPIADEPQQRTATEAMNIGLAVVKVPGYADTKLIASRINGTQVILDERHHWAELPEEAITRVLATRMRAYSGGTVIVEPWPRGFEPHARVEFDFDKLLRNENGGAEVSGQLRIIAGDGKSVIAVRSFQVVQETTDAHQQAYFVALSRAINDIARLALYSLRSEESLN